MIRLCYGDSRGFIRLTGEEGREEEGRRERRQPPPPSTHTYIGRKEEEMK